MWSVVIFVAVAADLGSATGEGECMPPPLGSVKRAPPSSCCTMEKVMPTGFLAVAEKCRSTFPRPPTPTGLPTTGEIPKELKEHHACMTQCIFFESKLLNNDMTLNENAAKTMFTTADLDFKPIMDAAITKCLASYKNNIDQTLSCTSGASEFDTCVLREVFINCPSSSWTSSTDCNDLKARVIRCPNLPIKMGGPHPH